MSLTQPAPLDQATLIGSTAVIKLSLIDASPFNPRKEFDKGEDADLDASIKERGLLENLVVRPKTGGRYELMGGERRWRSLKRIGAAEAQCNIREADDATAMAIQIVENLQRRDLGPLEEAEAFARLQAQDPKKWTVKEIAKAVGKTDRFVQQRIAIATNLGPDLKKRFSDGALSVEAARTLAALPGDVQKQIPSYAIEDNDAARIRRAAFDICIPETAAQFDVAAYKGDWILDDKQRRFFADLPQFMELQKPAAEKKLAEVRAEWPKAELVTAAEAGELHWADAQYPSDYSSRVSTCQRDGDKPAKFLVPREECRAIVWVAPNGQIRKALGVCTAAMITRAENKRHTQRAATANTRVKSPEGEKKDHKTERLAFNASIVVRHAC